MIYPLIMYDNQVCTEYLVGTRTERRHSFKHVALSKKATIHQVTTMLATSKHVLFPGHNHLLTIGADNPSLAGAGVIIKVSGHQHQ